MFKERSGYIGLFANIQYVMESHLRKRIYKRCEQYITRLCLSRSSIMLAGFALILCLFEICSNACADAPISLLLDDVVVTATKTERKIQDIPANVTVITRESIERRNILSLDDALRNQAGLSSIMAQDSTGSSRNIGLRGFRGQGRTQILLNGHPLNGGYNGIVDWSSLPIYNIERIEIVRGPYSALYGGTAMGGTIQIITHDPEKTSVYLKGIYGEDRTKAFHLHFGTRVWDRLSFSIGYEGRKTDGYIDQYIVKTLSSGTGSGGGSGGGSGSGGGGSPAAKLVTGAISTLTPTGYPAYIIGDKGDHLSENQGVTTQLSFDVSPSIVTKAFFMHQCSSNSYEQSHSYLFDPNGNAVWKGSLKFDPNQAGTMTLNEFSFISGEGEKSKNIYQFSFMHHINQDINYRLLTGYTDEYLNRYTLQSQNSTLTGGAGTLNETPSSSLHIEGDTFLALGKKHGITIGIGYFENNAEDNEWELSDWRYYNSRTKRLSLTEGNDSTVFAFIQDEYSIKDNILILAGVRYDYWQSKGKQIDANQCITHFGERNKDNYSPRLGISYHPWKKTQLRAMAGKAFRSPPIQALYNTSISTKQITKMNPDLEPEKTISWELGIDQELAYRTNISATYFENHITNMIYPRLIDSSTTPDIYLKENAGKGITRGVEFAVEHSITSGLLLWGNLTYQEAKITQNPANPASEGKRCPLVPWSMANVGMNFDKDSFHTSIAGQYTGKVYKEDNNSDYITGVFGGYDPYFILNAKFTYTPLKNLNLSLSVDNILDREYYEFNKAPGRSFFGEISYSY
ncbi:TonB-dependent receptor [bacterium]|nr:TonB-dependent receptor [bacterium]